MGLIPYAVVTPLVVASLPELVLAAALGVGVLGGEDRA